MSPEFEELAETASDVFDHLKGNGVQKLESLIELSKALHLMGRNPPSNALMNYWNAFGLSGKISFDNFLKITMIEREVDVERLLKVFINLGGNRRGYIKGERLKNMLLAQGDFMTVEDVEKIFHNYQLEDGNFPYLELCRDIVAHSALKSKRWRRPSPEASSNIMLISPPSTDNSIDSGGSNGDQTDQNGAGAGLIVDSRTFTRKKGSPKKQNGARSIEPATNDPFQNCKTLHVNGCFYMNDDRSVSGHQFVLNICEETLVCVAIQPAALIKGEVDTELLLFSEKEGTGRNLLNCTQTKDKTGRYVLNSHLTAGQYLLVPFTSGCRLTSRTSQPLAQPIELAGGSDEQGLKATAKFKRALQQTFACADLDRNGRLNYDEFNLFCAWTCGEMASHEEWDVVKSNFLTDSGELTEEGFMDLQLAQLEQNADGLEEVWTMLRKTGFNHALEMDEACPFHISVEWDNGGESNSVKPLPVSPASNMIERTLARIVVEQGSATRIKNLNDLTMHTLNLPHRTTIGVRNKSHSTVVVRFDCTGSENCISHRGTLDYTAEVPPRSSFIALHLLAANEELPFEPKCEETLIKIIAKSN